MTYNTLISDKNMVAKMWWIFRKSAIIFSRNCFPFLAMKNVAVFQKFRHIFSCHNIIRHVYDVGYSTTLIEVRAT